MWCVKSSQVWKILFIKKFFNRGFYKKRWRVFFLDLRQNIIDDVLSFQGHSCWLPSSHTAWPHQTLSEVHLEINFGPKGWKAASSLVLSYKWIFCQQLFFLHKQSSRQRLQAICMNILTLLCRINVYCRISIVCGRSMFVEFVGITLACLQIYIPTNVFIYTVICLIFSYEIELAMEFN